MRASFLPIAAFALILPCILYAQSVTGSIAGSVVAMGLPIGTALAINDRGEVVGARAAAVGRRDDHYHRRDARVSRVASPPYRTD